MVKRALCVGINTYPSAPLSGCVNDARGWAQLLIDKGYRVSTLLDGQADKASILAILNSLVAQSRFSDRIVFTFSGHGTWVPDASGDEPDRRDEAICPIDYARGGLILDDELEEVFGAKRFGVRATIISDSCHSGTVSRFADTHPGKARFIHPASFLGDIEAVRRADLAEPVVRPRATSKTVLMSGCDDTEYSYDAWIDNRPQGAFSAAALRTYRTIEIETGRAPSNARWHRAVREILPSQDYPQSPQMYASLWQRTWSL